MASNTHIRKPFVLWFTGLSASGKTTLATQVQHALQTQGITHPALQTYVLDGDVLRQGVCADLGFSVADRTENIRRASEVAKLLLDSGFVVLACFISPLATQRQLAKNILQGYDFFEVFVDTPLKMCMQRDPKGLYQKALAGDIKNFTGISSPYEVPHQPDIHIQTTADGTEQAKKQVAQVLKFLQVYL